MPGFTRNGSFYFGTRNDDVMAGYCLDAPPNVIRVYRFVLPVYDDVPFLHMGLGEPILTTGHDQFEGSTDLSDIVRRDWTGFSELTDCEGLIRYLDVAKPAGPYALWVRYLTYIWRKSFDAAEKIHTDPAATKVFLGFQMVSKQFTDLSEIRNRNGWAGCHSHLEQWQQKTKAAYF